MNAGSGSGSAARSGPGGDAFEVFAAARIVPVVTIDRAEDAPALVDALVRGGLPAVEITLRTRAALDAVRRAAAEVPGAMVGAGTVTSVAALHDAVDAGARFAVAPGFDPRVVEAARDRGVPFLPGVATATELMHAVELGVDVVKVFPVEPLGGTAILAAFAAVWPAVRFVPTGGVRVDTVRRYLDLPSVLAVGGSWMVGRDVLARGDWSAVTEAAAAAAALVGRPT